MQKELLALLAEGPLNLEALQLKLRVADGKAFVALNKALNELLERQEVVLIKDEYHLVSDYLRGVVRLRRGKGYLQWGNGEYEISGFNESGLFKNDEVLFELLKNRARVVSILSRGLTYVVGAVRIKGGKRRFLADDPLFKDFEVVNLYSFKGLKDLHKVRCYIADYRKRLLKIDEIIGFSYEEGIGVKSILLSYNVPRSFPSACLKEAERAIAITMQGRKDLRDHCFVTIDGDDSKDFDDAISVKRVEDGYVLYVAIADVASYVPEGSALDKEALKRGTSIYYPGQVIAMLPENLSNNLCSLMPGVDRLTLTVQLHYDFNGKLLQQEVYPSIICSKKRLTYAKVNRLFASDDLIRQEYSEVAEMLYSARILYSHLHERRMKHGGIDFVSDECVIKEEGGKVVDIALRQSGIAEKLIEDFMIAANVAVAEELCYLDLPCVYRNHDVPKADNLANYVEVAESLGYRFRGKRNELTSNQLAASLEYFAGRSEYEVLSALLLRCMVKAQYGNVSLGHFGLGLRHYCHFTSPIRRYPDLLVQRMLWRFIFNHELADVAAVNEHNEALINSCNQREKVAIDVERDIVDLKKCEYMQDHLGEVYDGVLSGVTSFGFYVKLANTVEGLVHISTLPGYFELLADGSLTDGKLSFKLGDRVRVKVGCVDIYRATIDFEFLRKLSDAGYDQIDKRN